MRNSATFIVKTDPQVTEFVGALFKSIRITQVATATTGMKGPRARPGPRFVVNDMTTALFIVCETVRTIEVMTFDRVVGSIIFKTALCPARFRVQELP